MTDTPKQNLTSIEKILAGGTEAQILETIEKFKNQGSAAFLQLLLNVLSQTPLEAIQKAIIQIISNLHTQEFTPVIVDFIRNHGQAVFTSDLISACWQSRLDFSHSLPVFAELFIRGNFQMAIECFTVIEEAIWQASSAEITTCRKLLVNQIHEVTDDKQALFNQLIQVLESGRTPNSDAFPELYPDPAN